MEYWTGGHFHAAVSYYFYGFWLSVEKIFKKYLSLTQPHRVRIITEGREAKDPRQSFVFFINPDGDTNVFPLVPILPKKKQQFEKFRGEPVNAFNHYQRHIEAATLY